MGRVVGLQSRGTRQCALTIPSRGTAHKLRLWVPFAASPLRRPLTSNVSRIKLMQPIDPLAPSLNGALSVLWEYLHFSPLVPVIVLGIRWRSLQSPFTFFLLALPLSVGVQLLWSASVASTEYYVFGAMYAHPQTSLWAFLRFDAPLYIVPLLSFAAVWLLSRQWIPRPNGHG